MLHVEHSRNLFEGWKSFEHESISIARILVYVGGFKEREQGKGSSRQPLALSLGLPSSRYVFGRWDPGSANEMGSLAGNVSSSASSSISSGGRISAFFVDVCLAGA